ncbi:unnamed protein product [Arabidopsis lyrata]|nr:unnamed protein product [Arabidopsis lyrata]
MVAVTLALFTVIAAVVHVVRATGPVTAVVTFCVVGNPKF